MITRALNALMNWALAKNQSDGYEGEDSESWAYTIKGQDGAPYLSRLLLPRIRIPLVGSFRPMLHKFHRADEDPELHNHPWKWAFSIILRGSYDEERLEAIGPDALLTEERRVRFFNVLTDADYHRVSRLHGEVWTLFVSGPRSQDWGFLETTESGPKHVPWRAFLADKAARARRTVTGEAR